MDTDNLACTAREVDKICSPFLRPRGFSYFQFKRVYKNGSIITLANHPDFFKDLLETNFSEFFRSIPLQARQSPIYSWDELKQQTSILPLLNDNERVYHGITFINRRKVFYDCTTFAMAECHPTPFSYYFNILKELQKFVEIFPTLARHLIDNITKKPIKTLVPIQDLKRKKFFLPKRSARFPIGAGAKDYVTTYEVFCLQLLQEGKSYKEIGSILSMSKNTVETHLTRLKARTGLSLQELSLQSFHPNHTRKKNLP
ncbi:MAG: hypothetical protein K0R76_491 [Alphaproteobacteria bacterium]|jgi:DNA-binding CsgD family transcriptional regulator|nr:hypothetical protein [Alphaproteobacteria bacterium]MDF3033537.1 hypothetical protein [Alphaproteobacteria bacterium]